MDPFTLTATCVGLIAAIAQLSSQISTFATRVKDARNDMQEVLQELGALSTNLEKMRDDQYMSKYPVSLRQNLQDTLKNCGDVTKQMSDLVQKLSSARFLGRFQWSLSKRDKLMSLKSKLEGHKSAIAIALLVASIFLTVEVKENTNKILSDTTAIRHETAQIPAQLTTLYQCMGSLQLHIKDLQQRGDNTAGHMFQHVMDNTTAYMHQSSSTGSTGRRSSDEFFEAQESFEIAFNTGSQTTAVYSRFARVGIAIDFGMTCTAVCWCDYIKDSDSNLNIIGRWPGNVANFAPKVPNLLSYKSGKLVSWGYLSNSVESHDGIEVYDNFKNLLEPGQLDNPNSRTLGQPLPGGFDRVRQLYLDFFREICSHIEHTLENQRLDLGESEVILSVPPNWSKSTLYHFQNLVKEAGLGSVLGKRHRLNFMTEPEAVVGSVLHQLRGEIGQISQKMVILVVDVGGTTMKSTMLSVDGVGASDFPKICELATAAIDGIGSKLIDHDFQRLVTARLAPIEEHLKNSSHPVKKAAFEMTRVAFQYYKATFGSQGFSEGAISYKIPVPGLSEDFSSEEAQVERGRLTFTVNDMRALFENQVREILSWLDHFLDEALLRAPESQLTHIVLSGGLCSSPYVVKRLKDHYQSHHRHRLTQSARFVNFQDPDLAVVKGMLLSRGRQQQKGGVIVKARLTRWSYGIVWNQLFNPHIHRDQELFRDETDGQVYARNQIRWFVGKHFDLDKLANNQIELPMVHRVAVNKQIQPWKHLIVMGDGTTSASAAHLSQNGVRVIFDLLCDFESIPKAVRKPLSAKYEEIHYSVVLIFRPASVDFEVRFDGETYSKASHHLSQD